MTSTIRPAVIHDRRTWSRSARALAPSGDRSIRITVGALNESHDGFLMASPYRGDIRGAQDAAVKLAHGSAAYLHDVISNEYWHRPAGGAWREGRG